MANDANQIINTKKRIFESSHNDFYIDSSDGEEKYFNVDNKLSIDDGESQEHNNDDVKNKFYNQIQNKVNKFIGKYQDHFDNVVVLLGAGASLNGRKDGGVTVKQLSKIIYEEVHSDKSNDKCFSIKELATNMGFKLPDDPSKDGFELEKFISRMNDYEQFCDDRESFKNTKEKIYKKIIENTSYDFSGKFNHDVLINLVNRNIVKKGKKLNIVTTNYDTLVEDAAEHLKYTVFDGFTFSRKPEFDDDMFNWNLSKPVQTIDTNESIYKSNVINLLKIHGSLTWKKDGDKIIRQEKPDKTSSDLPLMIFPSSDKYRQSYQEPYFSLFVKFQELIKQPNTLLITAGFSFSDNHIAEMIENAIKQNPELAVLITSHNIQKGNESESKILNSLADDIKNVDEKNNGNKKSKLKKYDKHIRTSAKKWINKVDWSSVLPKYFDKYTKGVKNVGEKGEEDYIKNVATNLKSEIEGYKNWNKIHSLMETGYRIAFLRADLNANLNGKLTKDLDENGKKYSYDDLCYWLGGDNDAN